MEKVFFLLFVCLCWLCLLESEGIICGYLVELDVE